MRITIADSKVLFDGSPSSEVHYFLFYYENIVGVGATGEGQARVIIT